MTTGEEDADAGSGSDDEAEPASTVGNGLADLLSNATEAVASGSDSEDEDLEEWVIIEEKFFYLEPVIRFMALFHSLVSFCMLIAYYHLKVRSFLKKAEWVTWLVLLSRVRHSSAAFDWNSRPYSGSLGHLQARKGSSTCHGV